VGFAKRVGEIVRPPRGGPPLDPSVAFVDVAGGHGLVALALLAFGLAKRVTIVDPFRPASFDNMRREGMLTQGAQGGTCPPSPGDSLGITLTSHWMSPLQSALKIRL
jgi:hypothetical protein